MPRAVALNVGLVRYSGVTWAETQPLASAPPVWTSSQTQQAFSGLLTITGAGLEPIVILRDAPAWARVNSAHLCGAIQPSRYGHFASFVIGFLNEARRRAIPLRYIEIFNEPDAVETAEDRPSGGAISTPATVGYQPVLVEIPLGRACTAPFGPRKQLTNDLKTEFSYLERRDSARPQRGLRR